MEPKPPNVRIAKATVTSNHTRNSWPRNVRPRAKRTDVEATTKRWVIVLNWGSVRLKVR